MLFFTLASLPYMIGYFWQPKKEDGLKVYGMFQSIFQPIESQTEEAFVTTIATVNQRQLSFGKHAQALYNHPHISQASSDQ
jgi:hypothetical protein